MNYRYYSQLSVTQLENAYRIRFGKTPYNLSKEGIINSLLTIDIPVNEKEKDFYKSIEKYFTYKGYE